MFVYSLCLELKNSRCELVFSFMFIVSGKSKRAMKQNIHDKSGDNRDR